MDTWIESVLLTVVWMEMALCRLIFFLVYTPLFTKTTPFCCFEFGFGFRLLGQLKSEGRAGRVRSCVFVGNMMYRDSVLMSRLVRKVVHFEESFLPGKKERSIVK